MIVRFEPCSIELHYKRQAEFSTGHYRRKPQECAVVQTRCTHDTGRTEVRPMVVTLERGFEIAQRGSFQ